MALALDAPFAATESRTAIRTGAFGLAAVASLGAGAIHAAAIGVHSEHDQAVLTFALVGGAQLLAGALSLNTTRKLVGAAVAAVNAAAFGGWVLAKRSGISFIDGMEGKEAVQWADGLAAGFAAVAVLAVCITIARRMRFPGGTALTRVLAVPAAVLALSGMVSAGSHSHAAGDDHHGATAAAGDHHAADGAAAGDGHAASAVPAKPFVPGEPIDLGGVPGVTAAQQAEAENVLAATLYYLPRWADYRVAEAEGWHSIGDGATGHEHFVNGAMKGDGKILDPTAPESLVYEVDRATGERTLVAAMFQLDRGTTMEDVPDTGGALMQWHIHDNLCFTADAKVAALRAPGAPCPEGLFIGGEEPMIHVWITSHKCGPFSALDGIGAGTIAEGETRLCDTAHGH